MVAFAHEKDAFIIEIVVKPHTLASPSPLLQAAKGVWLG
jgi:hypothetical protein